MRTPEFIERCIAAGMPLEMALKAAKAFEAECEIALEQMLDVRRAKDRARQAKHRAKVSNDGHAMSRDETLEDVTTVPERDLTCERAQVVNTTSSLRSEGNTPKNPSGSAPKGAARSSGKERRSRFVPPDWLPSDDDGAYAAELGFSPGEIERELSKFRAYEFARPYSRWSQTYRNWLDRAAERRPRQAHERPHHDDKFARKEANLARSLAGFEAAAGRGRFEP